MPCRSRREFLRSALAAGAAAAWFPTAARAQKKPLNILFLAVDDLRPELNCYGQQQIISPNIDRLASTGTLFERAYCQQAVCAPSRASLLSGCRPDTTKVWDLNTPLRTRLPDVVTLPQHFKEHGYTSLSRGKIYHHGLRDDPKGWSEDPWRETGNWQGRGYLDPASQKAVAELIEKLGAKEAGGRGPSYEAPDVPDDAYADGLLAQQGIADLNRLKDQPFFLALGFHKPHLPFNAPKKYWDLYRHEDIDLASNPFAPENVPPLAMMTWGELRAYTDMPAQGDLTEAQARMLIHGYYACTSYIDAQIGKVLDELDRLKLADNTAVVLWGDHGWQLGEHGLWCKHTNFEVACHAPMLFRAPGQSKTGTKTAALSEFVDIYPTLSELAGLPLPDHLEGTSAVPLLNDPNRPWKKAAFSQYPRSSRMGYSTRTARYRYTRWEERKTGELFAAELYDHQVDPAENKNLAGDPALARTIKELDAIHEAGWKGARPA